MSHEKELCKFIKKGIMEDEKLKGINVDVEYLIGYIVGSIDSFNKIKTLEEQLREKALAKLTQQERKLLGLEI